VNDSTQTAPETAAVLAEYDLMRSAEDGPPTASGVASRQRWVTLATNLATVLRVRQRNVESLSRRIAVRYEETEAAYSVIRRLMAGWTAVGASWWRDSEQNLITEAERKALRAGADDGVVSG
jgi:hypothetical protein